MKLNPEIFLDAAKVLCAPVDQRDCFATYACVLIRIMCRRAGYKERTICKYVKFFQDLFDIHGYETFEELYRSHYGKRLWSHNPIIVNIRIMALMLAAEVVKDSNQ